VESSLASAGPFQIRPDRTAARERNALEMHQSEPVQAHLRRLTLICFAFLSGILIYSGVVWFLLTSGSMPPEDLDLAPWMGTLFNGVALVVLVTAHFWPKLLRAPGRDASDEDLIAWHKRTTLSGFSLREGAALIALVGALLTGKVVGAIALVGWAIIAMLLAWPRKEQIEGVGPG
jgi:hypothetical protein